MRISDWISDVCSSDLKHVTRQDHCTIESMRRLSFGTMVPRISHTFAHHNGISPENGRASCRERVCQYVQISVAAASLTIKTSATRSRQANKSSKTYTPYSINITKTLNSTTQHN